MDHIGICRHVGMLTFWYVDLLADSPLRRDTFIPGAILPQLGRFVGRVGRPRQDWTRELIKAGVAKLGLAKFDRMLSDTSSGAQLQWKWEWQRVLPSRVQ